MNEELITFETAKLANEKGFPKLDYGYEYDKGGCVVDPTFYKGDYSIPSQSLLQRWIREKHNLKLWVAFNYTKEWFCYYVNQYDDTVILNADLREATYEEALEKGLIEGLKLIEL
jgi:hypothetical protein